MHPEFECLQAENARQREDRPELAAKVGLAAEVVQLKQLYAQVLQDIQMKEEQIVAARSNLKVTQEQLTLREAKVQEWQAKCKSLEKTCDTIRAMADKQSRSASLSISGL